MSSISLCIPTMNRFDSFLRTYLQSYLQYLKEGIIDEIVICDETGDDYQKILDTYGTVVNFRVFKNDSILGVFKNKLKVASLASSNYIALIDSDNFCDANYFNTVKKYISEKEYMFSSSVILAPSFAKPNFSYKQFENAIVTKSNFKDFYYAGNFETLLNTGNFVLNKKIVDNIRYDESVMFVITAADVLYFNLLAYLQFEDIQLHVVENLEYDHVVHGGSIYTNTIHNCRTFIDSVITPALRQLAT
jgi:hypothetical protein